MRQSASKRTVLLLLVTLITFSSSPVLAKKDKKKEIPPGTPVLWKRPTDINSRDLFLGPGGAAMRPDLRRITFIEEEKGGYSKKYKVRDASGKEWVAKIGKEAQPETSAVRLLWAVGYRTEINYLEPTVNIVGKGTFQNVRFEARPKGIKRIAEWKWEENPFTDTRELRGLKVMMALINNWDMKDSNNEILFVPGPAGNEHQYIISDLGATFGKSSRTPLIWRITRSRNEPVKYRKAKFVDEIEGNEVRFYFGGKRLGLFEEITVEDAKWIGTLLSELSDRQLRDAFRAANYSPGQIDLLVSEVRDRTKELVRLRTDQRVGATR